MKVNIFEEEFSVLQKLLEGVSLLGDYSEKIKDQVIAYGEILSAKYVAYVLNENSIKAQFTDSRQLIKTDTNFGNAQPIDAVSRFRFRRGRWKQKGLRADRLRGLCAPAARRK